MADLTSWTVGFITSTAMIVIFGEIIPQATFSRYALQVGEKAIPLMNVIICLFYIIAKPLALSSVEKNELENALGSKTVKTIKVDERGREYSSYEVFNGEEEAMSIIDTLSAEQIQAIEDLGSEESTTEEEVKSALSKVPGLSDEQVQSLVNLEMSLKSQNKAT
jgi:metal transporter CNNM